jgi:hypothetical protein
MHFVANLADDTTVSQGALLANSGVWPLYTTAYGGKGSVMGWLSFTNNAGSACAGTLRWIKGLKSGGKNYKNGFATRIPVVGSTFTIPKAGLGIGLSDSSVVLDAAKIYNPLNNPIVATNGNTISFSQTGVVAKQKLTVVPKFGRFTGTFLNPITHKPAAVKGIVLQDQKYAAGYFINSNLSGRVVLQHN